MRWCTGLWAKDLEHHLEYISDLTLASPRIFTEPAETDWRLDAPPFNRIKYIDLPSSKSYLEALVSLPELLFKMWRGIASSKIVHAGFGGWPVSEGWFAIPIGRLRRKFVISYVESSFWRAAGGKTPLHHRIRSYALERLNRFCVKISDLRFFTSRAYEREFLGDGDHSNDHSYVTPATWIDESVVLSESEASRLWADKHGTVQLLFAGRLIPEKGVQVLLDAIARLDRLAALEIAIMGNGPLARECSDFVQRMNKNGVSIKLLSTVPYGPNFFKVIRQFDAILLPSISDEQPRLIFDAFSQAVPVLGSDTGGIVEIVQDRITGRITRAGDASALSDLLHWAAQNRESLQVLGMNAVKSSSQYTHRAMHEQRSEIIFNERRFP